MRPQDLAVGAIVCASVAGVVSVWVAIHEFSYAGSHPYAVGPANVIGVAAVAGVLLSLAVIFIATAIRRGGFR